MDIHPQIRDFWEKSGYKISVQKPTLLFSEENYCMVWLAINKNNRFDMLSVAVSDTVGLFGVTEETCKIRYRFGPEMDRDFVSEDEALRILKLKAFI